MDTASLTHGYIANRVTERTKRVWFRWPDLNRSGLSRTREQQKRAREMRVEWDFHAQCALDELRAAIDAKATNRENGSERWAITASSTRSFGPTTTRTTSRRSASGHPAHGATWMRRCTRFRATCRTARGRQRATCPTRPTWTQTARLVAHDRRRPHPSTVRRRPRRTPRAHRGGHPRPPRRPRLLHLRRRRRLIGARKPPPGTGWGLSAFKGYRVSAAITTSTPPTTAPNAKPMLIICSRTGRRRPCWTFRRLAT